MRASLLLSLLICAARASALPLVLPTAIDTVTDQARNVRIGRDAYDRMTVPVHISERGPYRFLVDTGAERTVISRQLAGELGLVAGKQARLQSVAGISSVGTVDIPLLDVSSRRMAVPGAPALDAADLGADGVLGVDSLASTRILFDFQRNLMSVGPSGKDRISSGPDEIVVEARRRHGRLMFTHAVADGISTVVVIDTGGQISIGNGRLRHQLLGRKPVGTLVELRTVAGEKLMAELATIAVLDLDGVGLRHMQIAFIDAPVFGQLDLDRRPAMLLGMNGLKSFHQVSIDFATRRVRFLLPETGGMSTEQMAMR